MINFVDVLKRRIFSDAESVAPAQNNLSIIKSSRSILKSLNQSYKEGTVVGVYSQALGEGMFLTAVVDILVEDEEEIIELMRYDLCGYILPRTHLSISEIKAVCAFDIAYKNPVFSEKSFK